MADRLGQFTKEVQQLTTANSTYRLTPAGHQELSNALARASTTKAKVNAVWGGGEKSPPTPPVT